MIATTQAQSQRLLRCGVSADTADMIGVEPDYGYECESWNLMQGQDTRGYFPAWSLSALCELLFKSGHILSMQYERNEYRMQSFYSSGDFVTYGTTAIEACVNMIEKLTSNGYKLNEQ